MARFTRLLVVLGLFAASTGTSLHPANADPTLPLLRVGSATILEGDTGIAVVNVPVDLSTPSTTAPVTFNYAITGDNATAGQDFLARSGKITLKVGLASKQISVRVYGDTEQEVDEHIKVTLSNPVNATIAVANGGVTIQDDDTDNQTGLQVNIGDVTITEADGGTHVAELPVTLSQPAPSTVKVYYEIDCSSAFVGSDYTAKQHGTITFKFGTQSKLIKLNILADQTPELAKAILDTIKVTLGTATVNRTNGEGTIIDDDNPTPPPPVDPSNLGVGDLARVSVASDGTEATYPPDALCNGGIWGSSQSVVSADGRYIAYRSDAPNLVPGDTNAEWDIFVYDRIAGTTERVSVWSDGTQAPANVGGAPYVGADHPAISADGRYVTFWSAHALAPGVPDRTGGIFLHDRVTGETELISKNVDGTADTGFLDLPAPVSADGRYVAFESAGNNVVVGDTDPAPNPDPNNQDGLRTYDVFVRDRQSGTNTLVSVSFDGSGAAGEYPSMSNDGRHVAFLSQTETIVPGDDNGCRDVFVRDLDAGTTQRVNLTNSGEQELPDARTSCGFQLPVAISGDGSAVVWTSAAWNTYGLTSVPDYQVGWHAYVRNLTAGTTQRVDWSTAPVIGGQHVSGPSISDDGRYVSYECVCDDGEDALYVHDVVLDSDTLVGDLPDGTLPDGPNRITADGALSGDGHYVVFDSWATNLVPDNGDTNDTADVFVERLS